MDEKLQQELVEALSESSFTGLVQVSFDDNLVVCRQLGLSRSAFECAVNTLARSWIPIVSRYGLRLVTFGNGCYSRLLEDNSLGIRFGRIDAEVVKVAPDQNAKRV